ncbi:MAG: GNAT family N-acetyltransferase [Thermodesulfobacteriota bacterium]
MEPILNQGRFCSLYFLEWDTSLLGLGCGRLDLTAEAGRAPADQVLGEARTLLQDQKELDLIAAKIPSPLFQLAVGLLQVGGVFLDAELVFSCRRPGGDGGRGPVEVLDRWEGDDFLPLAEEMKHSRYCLDGRIPAARAHRLWRESISNHCRFRAEKLAVGYEGRKAAGLVAVVPTGPKARNLFLVGVLKEHQGRGIGLNMLKAVADYYGPAFDLEVECLAQNDSARRLYKKAGFVLKSWQYVLHVWR